MYCSNCGSASRNRIPSSPSATLAGCQNSALSHTNQRIYDVQIKLIVVADLHTHNFIGGCQQAVLLCRLDEPRPLKSYWPCWRMWQFLKIDSQTQYLLFVSSLFVWTQWHASIIGRKAHQGRRFVCCMWLRPWQTGRAKVLGQHVGNKMSHQAAACAGRS